MNFSLSLVGHEAISTTVIVVQPPVATSNFFVATYRPCEKQLGQRPTGMIGIQIQIDPRESKEGVFCLT